MKAESVSYNNMNNLKRIFNALATADRVELSYHPSKTDLTQSECFIAAVNFCNNTTDDNFYIDIRDTDEYFAPIHLYKNQLNEATIEGNKIKIDDYVIELFKFSEHNI